VAWLRSKKLVPIVFFAAQSLILSLFFAQPVQAATKVWSTTTPIDTYNRPDLPPQFDIVRVEVGLFDSDLDQVHFWIQFKNAMLPGQFNDSLRSWAGILIDTNNDDQEDLRLETRPASYTKNFWQSAYASKNCTAVSWMNLDSGNDNVWLGFKVSQKCLSLPNKFRVQAYADFNANDNSGFDYAPDAFATIDLGDYYNPKPKVTTAVPFSTSDSGRVLSNYSSVPDNLADLASRLRDSVVTIECVVGGSIGTGTAWAAKVQMPNTSNYQSYLVTNYHVISDCIYKGNVDVILNNKTKINGLLAAWDPDNDLAGIYVTTRIEPMLWQGATPLQGGWAGVLGSPKGLPGVLTTGIVSSVDEKDKWMTFTAPINPGNSGGPVFDSTGRVMAVATAKARDSEGFGIGNGVPLLCEVVIRCASGQSGWSGVPAKISSEVPKKSQILQSNPAVPTYNYAEKSVVSIGLTSSSTSDINIFSTAGLLPTLVNETPSICGIQGTNLKLISSGTCIIRAEQSGNSEFAPAASIKVTIGSFYSKIMKSQFISNDPVTSVKLSERSIKLRIYSSSSLPISVVPEDYDVCASARDLSTPNEYTVFLFKAGTCVLNAAQSGNSDYLATSSLVTFEVLPNERVTILCKKGSTTKQVRGINPKCPKGYKRF
jgi:hypothetical protein